MSDHDAELSLSTTPLHARHVAAGARMVPFAGYDMPVQYPDGIMAEHVWTRAKAGLFDVSHMGQARLVGPDHATTARALEALIPADILNLKPGRQRYSQLLNEQGGILDDLMVTRSSDPSLDGTLILVVNAGCKAQDYAHIAANLPDNVTMTIDADRALLALQGPDSEAVLAKLSPDAAAMRFMDSTATMVAGVSALISRSGYTGEDGYEISIAARDAGHVWDKLVADASVKPIGLGARDSLRLEAGLCLYGHDINQETSPVEAALTWSIQRRRRDEGGFPGAVRITTEMNEGPLRMRVGLLPEGRAPAREGSEIRTPDGVLIGEVTSGGFGPSVNGPVAMGYVVRDMADVGTQVHLMVRGKPLPARVVPLPFVANTFKR
jgi:aminomethyltransferase